MGNSSIPVQALTVFVIVICTFFVQFKIKPYATHQLNSLEARAILVSALTIYCGLFYLTKDITYAVKVILFLIIVIVNFIFLSYWISNMTGVGIAILYTKVRFLRRLLRGTRFEKWIISVAPIPITVTDENVDGTFYDSNLDKSYAKYHKSPDKTAEDSTVVPTITFLTEDMSCLPHISNIETNYDEDRVERIEIPSSKIVLDGNLQDKSNK